jgi:hypothetical protein
MSNKKMFPGVRSGKTETHALSVVFSKEEIFTDKIDSSFIPELWEDIFKKILKSIDKACFEVLETIGIKTKNKKHIKAWLKRKGYELVILHNIKTFESEIQLKKIEKGK